MRILNLKKEPANMKIYYYLIVVLTIINVSCKNKKRLLPTDNSGGYIIQYLPKQLNDTVSRDFITNFIDYLRYL